MTKRILITGSRDWEDWAVIYEVLSQLWIEYGYRHNEEKPTLVSGACPTGADKHCEDYANSMKWTVETHPADWDKYGRRAGFIRNSAMVNAGADICLAFIKNNSKGATMTRDLALKAGIETRTYEA